MCEKAVQLPSDEQAEEEHRTRRARLAEMALRHVRLADIRTQEDTEKGDSRGASWESQLCLKWIRQWRELTE